jgi:hypothetical protein
MVYVVFKCLKSQNIHVLKICQAIPKPNASSSPQSFSLLNTPVVRQDIGSVFSSTLVTLAHFSHFSHFSLYPQTGMERIKLQRLMTKRTFGAQARFVPGFGGEVEAGGLVFSKMGIAGNGCDYFDCSHSSA